MFPNIKNQPKPETAIFCIRDIFTTPFPVMTHAMILTETNDPRTPLACIHGPEDTSLDGLLTHLYPGVPLETLSGYRHYGSLLQAWDTFERACGYIPGTMPDSDNLFALPSPLLRFWIGDGYGWISEQGGWIDMTHLFNHIGCDPLVKKFQNMPLPSKGILMVGGSTLETPFATQQRHQRLKLALSTLLHQQATSLHVIDL